MTSYDTGSAPADELSCRPIADEDLATRPLGRVAGRYFPNRLPIYAKGPEPQSSIDLTYTERALVDF